MLGREQTEKALQQFAKYVIQQSRSNLTKNKSNDTRKLYESLKAEYKVSANSFEMAFKMEKYGEFQDKGVKGANPGLVKNGIQKAPNSPFSFKNKMIPTKALDGWVVRKGIAPRTANGRFASRNGVKFAIAKSIFAQGLKPTEFFSNPFEAGYKKFITDDLQKSFSLDVDNLMKYTLREDATNN